MAAGIEKIIKQQKMAGGNWLFVFPIRTLVGRWMLAGGC
jgi:hypothetical protein